MKRILSGRVLMAAAFLAAGCAGTPPPDWQMNLQGSMQRALEAHLSGNDRVATNELARAREEASRTGRPDLMARVELLRCAVDVASLQFGVCGAFERYRADAAAPELAYAAYLQGKLQPSQASQLPPTQQPLAVPGKGDAADLAALQAVADPLSRLVGAAVWLQAGRSSPTVVALAVDTASAQGWRRALLAWLQVQQRMASQAGDMAEAARIGRRIELVFQGGKP
jgi:hypothetical protein